MMEQFSQLSLALERERLRLFGNTSDFGQQMVNVKKNAGTKDYEQVQPQPD